MPKQEKKEKRLYKFEGAVLLFDRPYADRWSGKTVAVSPEKARSNLAYQFRKTFGLADRTPITLLGPIKEEAASSRYV